MAQENDSRSMSAAGNPAAGGMLLPSFIENRADGLYVIREAALADASFVRFVERVFGAELRFAGLIYATFLDLLYGLDDDTVSAPLKVADGIATFTVARQVLYRGLKIAADGKSADYLFEQLEIEVEDTEPAFAPPAGNGDLSVVWNEKKTRMEPTRLNFDEFVAAMWMKGLRFGLDEACIRSAIAGSQAARLVIAHALMPTASLDASIVEKTQALHRDNAPRILPDGRMDLHQFKNRFPQIGANAALLQKIPRKFGKPGFDVTGKLLKPEEPKDFDLTKLAGDGTRIESGAAGEFIVSARDGFINIDAGTNLISVTEKIVSRDGVSMRATGDVILSGDEFEEYGEVQERRVVEGHHMTFHAGVYGRIVSRGGNIVLKDGISGGEAISPGGNITVEGRASRSALEARGGEIRVEHAESCTIVGSRVRIDHAVNCDILGEMVIVGKSEGCAIAGKDIRVERSDARKETETIIALLVPDTSGFVRDIEKHRETEAGIRNAITVAEQQLADLMADGAFKQYLAVAAMIANGTTKLNAASEPKWRQTREKFAPRVHEWQTLQKLLKEQKQALAEEEAERQAVEDKLRHAADGIRCAVPEIAGDTLVRKMAVQPGHSVVGGAQAREIAAHLREFGVSNDRLFWAGSGSFAWQGESQAAPGG